MGLPIAPACGQRRQSASSLTKTVSGHLEVEKEEAAEDHHGAHHVSRSMAMVTQASSAPPLKRPPCCQGFPEE